VKDFLDANERRHPTVDKRSLTLWDTDVLAKFDTKYQWIVKLNSDPPVRGGGEGGKVDEAVEEDQKSEEESDSDPVEKDSSDGEKVEGVR